jgi:hypothetical protein
MGRLHPSQWPRGRTMGPAAPLYGAPPGGRGMGVGREGAARRGRGAEVGAPATFSSSIRQLATLAARRSPPSPTSLPAVAAIGGRKPVY